MQAVTLTIADELYPRGVADLDPAPVLRVQGALPAGRGVAIVGTRSATPEAAKFAAELAGALTREGFVVWSGGALGIDAAAHRGAMDSGGRTVVVLGGGLDRLYPAEHADLFDEVLARGGALVSLTRDDVHAERAGFHARNAVVAAATCLTIVVECGVRSGALSTAAKARSLGRPLAFVPHAPWSQGGSGCIAEIRAGRGSVVGCAADALDLLGVARPRPALHEKVPHRPTRRQRELFASVDPRVVVEAGPPRGVSGLELALWTALDAARHVDDLCDRVGRSPKEVVPLLVSLALAGFVVEVSPGVYRRG